MTLRPASSRPAGTAPVLALLLSFPLFTSIAPAAHADDPGSAPGSAPAAARRTAVFADARHEIAIDPARGSDPAVDYTALVRIGPWDDRNYALTSADLALLSPNEHEQLDPVPAFFRVVLRRNWKDLPRIGVPQYPRSALQIFRLNFHGYLVDGRYCARATYENGRFVVNTEAGAGPDADAGGLDADAGGLDAPAGEARITSPNGWAESAIKVNPVNTSQVVAGAVGPSRQTMHYSTDGGSSWTQVELPLGGTCCDPAVDWSSSGTYAYAVTLGACGFSGCQLWFYRSTNGGQTWTSLETQTPGDPRREVATSGADKEYLHVDKYASSPFKDRLYMTWHRNNVMQFAYSADFGNTWTSQAFPNTVAEQGIGSDITTDKAGAVYYFWPGVNNNTIRMRKSTNGGASFGSSVVVATTQDSYDFAVPSMDTRRVFIYTSADADLSSGPYGGSVYVAWTDNTGPETSTSNNHARIQVAYSRNGGSTWTVTTPHETADQLTVDRWHPWLAVGPDGTVHVVYYDTRNASDRRSVDLYYSYSTTGGQTWSAPRRVTTVMSNNIVDGFEYGDYNGLDIVLQQLIAIFTDNRRESGGSGDSVDVYSAGIAPGSPGPVCGNGVIESGETCDGPNLGAGTCASLGCTGGGTPTCSATCTGFDTSTCLGCAGVLAGRVPDGRLTPGQELAVAKQGPADLHLVWGAACASVQDYEVYEGTLGTWTSHAPKLCTTAGQTTATITPAASSRYYLAVAVNRGVEGSYGRRSDGTERPAAASSCVTRQGIANCP